MQNKVISIFDINDFKKQNTEVLLFANILEKKYPSLSVIDLNELADNHLLRNIKGWKNKDNTAFLKLFNISNYHIVDNEAKNQNTIVNLIGGAIKTNSITLINPCHNQQAFNKIAYKFANELVLFADLQDDLNNKLLNFFINYPIKDKNVKLFITNYVSNVQNDRLLLETRKLFCASNIEIELLDAIPSIESIKQLQSIEPWTQIYKKINSIY